MTVDLRAACADDRENFLRLVDALADYERLDRPDPAARERLVVDAFGPRPRFDLLLALENGTAIGYALFFETYSSFLARPTLYLEDLFVVPAARGHGAGLALFRAVAAEALRRDCGRMEWTVLRWNQLAIDFYQRLGAVPMDEWQTYRLTGEALAGAGADSPPAHRGA